MRERQNQRSTQVDPLVSPRFFGWWFFLTAPLSLSEQASYETRDAFRRGRLTALVLLFELYIITVITITVGIPSPNPFLLPLLVVLLAALIVATVLNKMSKIRLAGWIAVIAYQLAVGGDILTTPGGLTVFALPLFDLFVQVTMIAASLLQQKWIKWIAGGQILFIIGCILFMHRAPDFAVIAKGPQFADALLRPVFTNFIAAYAISLWVSGAMSATARADREKGVAELEREIAIQGQRDKEVLERDKEVLERSLQQVIAVHAQVANGNLSARVPIDGNNVLWSITGPLNSLLGRYQQARSAQKELEYTKQVAQRLFVEWQEAKRTGQPIQLTEPTGTVLDIFLTRSTQER
jgi:hypothetical protein